MTPKLIFIEWHDAYSCDGWLSKRDLEDFINREKCIVQNVGWVLSETRDEIVLGRRRLKWAKDGDCEWGMVQKIPKTWIRKKKVIYLQNTPKNAQKRPKFQRKA